MSNDDNLLKIRNRKLLSWDQSNGYSNGVTKSRGGSVAGYTRKDLAPSSCILSNLCVTNPHIELLVIKVALHVHKTRLFLIVYRPPTGTMIHFF